MILQQIGTENHVFIPVKMSRWCRFCSTCGAEGVVLTLTSTYCLIITLGCFPLYCHFEGIKKQKQQIQPFQTKLHCGYYELCERRSSGSYRRIITLVSVLMCRQAAVLWVCMHAGLFQSCRLMTREERVKQFAVSQSLNGDIFTAMEQDITSSSVSWESVRSEHIGVKSCLEIKQGLV